jgi:hypothetical protein
VARFLAFLPSGRLPAPCFPGPEAGQRPDRTAAAAPRAFGVGDTLHTLSLQQWVNAEAGQSAARDVFVLACRRWIGSGRHVQLMLVYAVGAQAFNHFLVNPFVQRIEVLGLDECFSLRYLRRPQQKSP